MSDHKQNVIDRVNERSKELISLSHKIHANPEVAWQEFESAAAVAKILSDNGFDVVEQVSGLQTAFRAEFGSGDLTVALCAEYDALPGLGHACGHNIIASSSVGAAIALASVAKDLNIRVVVLGTPAEEGGGGKIVMLERGAFDGIDVAALVHPGPVDVAFAEPFAVRHIAVKFSGKAAHAAAYPEQGVNAASFGIGANFCMISFLPPKAAMGIPPPMPLAQSNTSGTMPSCSKANNVPVRPKPVCISSKIKRVPVAVQRSRTCFKNSKLGTVTPDSVCIGSNITAAVCSFISSSSLVSLYCNMRLPGIKGR